MPIAPAYWEAVTLEFSRDPLSDTTPSWTDVSSDLREVEWFAGISDDLDSPQAGGARLRLKNTNRRWEPEYEAGEFFPDIDLGRRFRLTLDDGTTSAQVFVGYVADFDIEYPAGTTYSEVVVTLVDGAGLLAQDFVPFLDPPDAQSYPDVLQADSPFGYWPLNDPRTAAKASSLAGPEGVYRNRTLLRLEEPGAILGSADTSVYLSTDLTATANATFRATLSREEWMADGNAVTVSLWVKLPAAGPDTAHGFELRARVTNPIWTLTLVQNYSPPLPDQSSLSWDVRTTTGTVRTVIGNFAGFFEDWTLIEATWDGGQSRIRLNGELAVDLDGNPASAGFSGRIDVPTAPIDVILGARADDGEESCWAAHLSLYETALAPARTLAHYQAGAQRGFPQQTAGARVASAATSPVWSTSLIPDAGHTVKPVMKHGQSPLEVITDTARAETPFGLFFFNGDGNPVYLPWDYPADHNQVQAVFGDDGTEIRYRNVELEYDDRFYNEATASREDGPAQTAVDTASRDARGRRVATDLTGLVLANDTHAAQVAQAVVDHFSEPTLRARSLTVEASKADARTQILTREIGDLIRVRRRGEGGTPIDRIAHIIGKSLTLDRNGHLTCTWNLSRGFNAAIEVWRLGYDGYSELDDTTGTTVLA